MSRSCHLLRETGAFAERSSSLPPPLPRLTFEDERGLPLRLEGREMGDHARELITERSLELSGERSEGGELPRELFIGLIEAIEGAGEPLLDPSRGLAQIPKHGGDRLE